MLAFDQYIVCCLAFCFKDDYSTFLEKWAILEKIINIFSEHELARILLSATSHASLKFFLSQEKRFELKKFNR